MELAAKTALVTGGSNRLGRAIAMALARAGCPLVIHYRSSADQAAAAAAEAASYGVEVVTHRADLGEPGSAAGLLEAAAPLGPVRLLVNSAAGFPADGLLDITPDGLDRTLRTNLGGAVFVTQAFASALPEDLTGAVVNVTDWKTMRPYREPRFSYTVSKGALDTFTRVAAAELAPRIRVNAVALGVILPPAGAEEGYAERLAADLPLGRVGGVDVVTEAVLHLLSNDFITGEIVRLDGGGHLR